MSVAKSEKIGLFGGLKRWLRSVWGELKKVHWPTRKEIVAYTIVVMIAVALVGVGIWIADLGISFLMQFILQ